MQYSFNEVPLDISKDISVRANVDAIIYGTKDEAPRGIFAVLQTVLRDEKGSPIKSPFTYKLTGEGKNDNRGPHTTRTGYLCNEKLIRAIYKPATLMRADATMSAIGMVAPEKDIFILSWRDEIKAQDVIVLIKTDDNGNIINPVTIEKEFIVSLVYPKKLDNGRVEFYTCIIEDQK